MLISVQRRQGFKRVDLESSRSARGSYGALQERAGTCCHDLKGLRGYGESAPNLAGRLISLTRTMSGCWTLLAILQHRLRGG